MSAAFRCGDRVVCAQPLPSGATVRGEGEVRQIDGQRVLVRFANGMQVWQMAHGVTRMAPPQAPLRAVPPPSPAGRDPMARLEASGVDVVMVWREIGAGLRDRARRAIAAAEEDVQRAGGEIATAEALLADTRRELVAAKARAEAARKELAIVERDLGVLR